VKGEATPSEHWPVAKRNGDDLVELIPGQPAASDERQRDGFDGVPMIAVEQELGQRGSAGPQKRRRGLQIPVHGVVRCLLGPDPVLTATRWVIEKPPAQELCGFACQERKHLDLWICHWPSMPHQSTRLRHQHVTHRSAKGEGGNGMAGFVQSDAL